MLSQGSAATATAVVICARCSQPHTTYVVAASLVLNEDKGSPTGGVADMDQCMLLGQAEIPDQNHMLGLWQWLPLPCCQPLLLSLVCTEA
jgi:hypothetical protein